MLPTVVLGCQKVPLQAKCPQKLKQDIITCSSQCQEDGPGTAPRQRAFGCCPASLHSQAVFDSISGHGCILQQACSGRSRHWRSGVSSQAPCMMASIKIAAAFQQGLLCTGMHHGSEGVLRSSRCYSECALWPQLPDTPYMHSSAPDPFAVTLRGATAKTWSMPGTWLHAGMMTRPSMPDRSSQWPICMTESACGCRWCRLELSRGFLDRGTV